MSARDPVSPRAWIGTAAFPWPSIELVREGEAVVGCYCVVNVQQARTKADKPYLKLVLSDRNGTIEARVWEDAEVHEPALQPGSYVGVRGKLEIFNLERQVRVDDVVPLSVELEELDLFLPRSERGPSDMDRELEELIRSIRDVPLRTLVNKLLSRRAESGAAFRLAPAAKYHHHAFIGGLQEHTLSVARICDLLASHYGEGVDRDLLIAGALLHDIGKVREIGAKPGFPYTDEGKLLGHILLGMRMVQDVAVGVPELSRSRLLLLEHLIASHQGRYEWQSPREPLILEGLLLHYADDMDAKINQVARILPDEKAGWSEYDRSFGRSFLRHIAPAEPEDKRDTPLGNLSKDTLDLFGTAGNG
ncbi:MAG: HD domain-containing protein [Longimicrobiales bacterium]